MDFSQFTLFLAASLVLLLIPGPAVFYIVAQGMEQGPRYGVVSAAGIAVGGIIHVFAAVLGLSALLAASSAAFSFIKYLGAAYLIYLGISKLLEKPIDVENAQKTIARRKLDKVFWQGVVVQILNPKIALFFLSFLPQFVNPQKGNVTLQIAVIGFLFVVLGFLTDSAYALAAGKFGHKLSDRLGRSSLSKWFVGFTYLGLGFFTALTGRKTRS